MDYLCLFVTLVLISTCVSTEVDEELKLTKKELKALESLRSRVKSIEAHDWLKSDLALLRWLRVNKLNVEAATEAFKANLRWREENKLDSILDEDWSYFKQNYYMDETATDFAGRPVVAADASDWNVRGAILAGRGEQLFRYIIRALEAVAKRVREAQENGRNVTQWQVIMNMDNFNFASHACIQCLPIYIRFMIAHESYYPMAVDKVIVINAPQAAEVIYRTVRPVLSPAMREALMIFGINKQQWKKYISSLIPEDELAPNFGGTKNETLNDN